MLLDWVKPVTSVNHAIEPPDTGSSSWEKVERANLLNPGRDGPSDPDGIDVFFLAGVFRDRDSGLIL